MVSQPSCPSPPARLASKLSRTRFGPAVSEPWVPPRKRSSTPSTLASRGWANYHRPGICSETFARLDRFVWRRLYRWAKPRHPDKSGRGNAERYFPHQPGEAWRFTDPLTGKPVIRVQEAVKPQRYLKVKGEANPFDPVWEGILSAPRPRTGAARVFGVSCTTSETTARALPGLPTGDPSRRETGLASSGW
jgi:hypothetical protein